MYCDWQRTLRGREDGVDNELLADDGQQYVVPGEVTRAEPVTSHLSQRYTAAHVGHSHVGRLVQC